MYMYSLPSHSCCCVGFYSVNGCFGFLNAKLGQGVFYVLLCHIVTLCLSDSKETTSTSHKKVKHNTGKSKNLNVEVS